MTAPETAGQATTSRVSLEASDVAGDEWVEAAASVERDGEPDPELADQMLIMTPAEMAALYSRLKLFYEQGIWSTGTVETAAQAAIAAAAPAGQPSPEVIRAAFRDFLASQGYEENDRFDQDEMELAFETGMYVQAAAPAGTTGAPVCPGCRQPFDPAKGCIRTCACIGPAETTQHPEQPQAAPELAAATPPLGTAWRLLDETRAERDRYRDGIDRLIDHLKTTAAATHPSKKSEIEFALIRKLQAILDQP